jgi:DNA-directed RNA polymerase specialized sigma24 family protein
VWRKAAQFDPTRASPITWLVSIARNEAIDRLRKRKREFPLGVSSAEKDYPDTAPNPQKSMFLNQRRAIAEAGVASLADA